MITNAYQLNAPASSPCDILGGTNLRVCLVTLQGEGEFEITQSKYRLTEDQKQDDGQKLFDFCAECLKTFIDTNLAREDGGLQLKEGETFPLGFTVSPTAAAAFTSVKIYANSISVFISLLVSLDRRPQPVPVQPVSS